MTNCPVCNTKVDVKAKFCPECGVELSKRPRNAPGLWQCRKKIRVPEQHNIFTTIAAVGIVIAVVVPYYTHFIRLNNMDSVSLGTDRFGALLIIGSGFGIWWKT